MFRTVSLDKPSIALFALILIISPTRERLLNSATSTNLHKFEEKMIPSPEQPTPSIVKHQILETHLKQLTQANKSKDKTEDLDEINDKIKLIMDSIARLISEQNKNKQNMDTTKLEREIEMLEKENEDIKRKEVTRKLKEDLRIRATDLLVEAGQEINLNKKASLLDEAAGIIGKV